MDRLDRSGQLAGLVLQARHVCNLAKPTTAYVLRILDALTDDDVAVLGRWQLRDGRGEAIVDRLSEVLVEQRAIVRRALSDCLRLDLWGEYDHAYATWRQRYDESGEADAAIEESLGRPPHIYSFLLHGCIDRWIPKSEEFSTLIIEDNRWGAICDGYLVARGRAFSTKLALMEVSVREKWHGWQALWRWF